MTQEYLKTSDEIFAYTKILIGPLIVAGIIKKLSLKKEYIKIIPVQTE